MKTDIIYRSVVKETGEEVLVYKNFFDKYRDFKSTREFKEEELEHFISLTKMLDCSTNVPKNSALQLYYSCKNTELFYHSVYIGDLAIIKGSDNESNLIVETIAQNRVFRKYLDEYIDLENYERYKDASNQVGDKIVVNKTLIKEHFNNELPGSRQSRQKILALCQKKFQNQD